MDYKYRSPLEEEYPESNKPYTTNSNKLRPAPYNKPGSRDYTTGYWTFPQDQDQSILKNPSTSYSSRYKLCSYPKELNDMFGALECKLCSVEVSSPIVAKMHYSGKQHMKKIKNFLTEWSLKTGNALPGIADQTAQYTGSLEEYCNICDVKLSSLNDKILHYAGKSHRKNEQDPANAKKKKKVYETMDTSDGRFGIGTSFSKVEEPDSHETKPEEFVCELCDVKAVSHQQLQIHLDGKKHKEKLRKKSSLVPKPGQYYCDVCDLTLNAELQFIEHVENKRHKKKLMAKSLTNQNAELLEKDRLKLIFCKKDSD